MSDKESEDVLLEKVFNIKDGWITGLYKCLVYLLEMSINNRDIYIQCISDDRNLFNNEYFLDN